MSAAPARGPGVAPCQATPHGAVRRQLAKELEVPWFARCERRGSRPTSQWPGGAGTPPARHQEVEVLMQSGNYSSASRKLVKTGTPGIYKRGFRVMWCGYRDQHGKQHKAFCPHAR